MTDSEKLEALVRRAEHPPLGDPLDSTYSSLLVTSLTVAVIFMGLIIAWAVFGE